MCWVLMKRDVTGIGHNRRAVVPSSLPLPLRNQPAPHLVEAADAVVHVSPEQALRQVLVLDHGQLERVALQPRVVVAAGRRQGGEGPARFRWLAHWGSWGSRAVVHADYGPGPLSQLAGTGNTHVWIARPMPSITTAGRAKGRTVQRQGAFTVCIGGSCSATPLSCSLFQQSSAMDAHPGRCQQLHPPPRC